VVRFAETADCRRRHLLRHFGETLTASPEPCCDNCGWGQAVAA